MKYGKRVREEAVLLLATMASSDLERCHTDARDSDFEATLGISCDATTLAWRAWQHVAESLGWPGDITAAWLDAEAEALIRTGWTP